MFRTVVSFGLMGLLVIACGDSAPEAKAPENTAAEPAPAVTASEAPPAAPVASAPAAPPALKGSFTSFTRAANSGKVDKVGEKDGAFKPDGVKDLVFEGEFEGPAASFFIVSVTDSGEQNGEFDADTMVGDQQFPDALARTIRAGKFTAGVGIYEDGKLLNDKDGAVAKLSEGKHKLTFHISSKQAGKGPMRPYAVLTDNTVVEGPVAK